MSRSNKPIGVRVHVRLTASQLELVRHFAKRGGFTVSETLRRALDEFLSTKYRKG